MLGMAKKREYEQLYYFLSIGKLMKELNVLFTPEEHKAFFGALAPSERQDV